MKILWHSGAEEFCIDSYNVPSFRLNRL